MISRKLRLKRPSYKPKALYRLGIVFATLVAMLYPSCQKPELLSQKPKAVPISGSIDLKVDLSDVVAKLPKTLMHNLGTDAKLYVSRVQWHYNDRGIIMRIPTTSGINNYLYVTKTYANPEQTNVYAVKFIPKSLTADTPFSGKQVWLDFQEWKGYGIEYVNGQPVNYLEPQILAAPDWESLTLKHGHYLIDNNGDVVVNPGPPLVPMSAPDEYDCPGEGSWLGDIFGGLGDFFGGIGDWLGGIFGEGGGGGGNTPPGGGGNWDGGFGSTGPGGGYGGGNWDGGSNGGDGGPNPGGGGGNWDGGNPNPDPGGPTGPGGAPLTINGSSMNGVPSIAVNEVPDNNGFLPSRIAALGVYLQSKPDGMLDCADISSYPMNMYQQVGSYSIPQEVLDRIENIRSAYPSIFNANNFKLQDINDAEGPVVNLDYFPVHITELPNNSNNVQMTPDEFLEYFRNSLDFFVTLGGQSASFSPYIQSPFSDHPVVNAPYEASLGGLLHINIPSSVPGVYDDGTVIISGYQRDFTANFHWFMFTTMTSPLDGQHPVAGNRIFGIFPDNINGGYCFYTMGVDRTYSDWVTWINNNFNSAFNGADALWSGVQNGILSHLNYPGNSGSAVLYSPPYKATRPKWESVIKKFLQGQITLLQMKLLLNCP